jgi:hypothetical protein
MPFCYKNILTGIIILFSASVTAQESEKKWTDSLVRGVEMFLARNNTEDVYLHSDKWIYKAGETIYFRAYCLNDISHKLDRNSKLLFVDLVNANDSIVSRLFLNNDRFKTEGYIILPDVLSQGEYWLRAYTPDIVKKDSEAVYIKHLYVFNPSHHGAVSDLSNFAYNRGKSHSEIDQYQISLYPEGGSIIEGTDQIVVVRITDSHGIPVAASGYLTNEEDSIVARFTTSSSGYGKFSFFVENQENYLAHIGLKDGPQTTRALTKANANSARLSLVKESDTAFTFFVALGDTLFRKEAKTVILGVNRGRLFYGSSGKSMYQVQISKKNIPSGESDFLLFTEDHKLMSQRSIYFPRNNILIEVKADKPNYQAREKVKLDIMLSDEKKQPVIALLSLAVTNDKTVSQPSEEQVLNEVIPGGKDFGLYTQKRGYEGLKYSWENSNNLPDPHWPGQAVYIKGKVLNKKGIPQNKQQVTLFSAQDQEEVSFGVDTTDATGSFHFPLPMYSDSISFQLEVTNFKGVQQDVSIQLDSFNFPKFKTPEGLKIDFDDSAFAFLQHAMENGLDTVSFENEKKMLAAVTVRALKKKPLTYDDNKRISQFSRIISWDMIQPGANGISNALIMVPGVQIIKGLVVIKGPGSFALSTTSEPLLVIDGAALDLSDFDDPAFGVNSPVLQYLNSLSVESIDFIEVLAGPEAAFYGIRSANGVIVINTRTGNRTRIDDKKTGLKQFYTRGYLTMIPYVGLSYNTEEEKKRPYPDQRSTLYWNGNILTDEKGLASVDFFTADDTSNYTVSVIGVTVDGEIICKKWTIVRK